MKRCPKCEKIAPDNPWLCDCGYEFDGSEPHTQPTEADVKQKKAESYPWIRFVGAMSILGFAFVSATLALVVFENFCQRDDSPSDGKLRIYRHASEIGIWGRREFSDASGRKTKAVLYGKKNPGTAWEKLRSIARWGIPKMEAHLEPVITVYYDYNEPNQVIWEGWYSPQGELIQYHIRPYGRDGPWFDANGKKL
jgi:hypothetical protein